MENVETQIEVCTSDLPKMGYVVFNRANNNGCNAKLIWFES